MGQYENGAKMDDLTIQEESSESLILQYRFYRERDTITNTKRDTIIEYVLSLSENSNIH